MKTLPLIFFVCALPLYAGHTLASRDVFRNDARSAAVEAAKKAEVCFLTLKDPDRRIYTEGVYRELPNGIVALISWKLLEDISYTWDLVPACEPTYNARVRFTSDKRAIEVDFCFGCSQIRVLEGGVTIGGGYFAPGSEWVFRALSKQFPNEPVIHRVAKRREEEREEMAVIQLEIEIEKAENLRKQRANQHLRVTDQGKSSGE